MKNLMAMALLLLSFTTFADNGSSDIDCAALAESTERINIKAQDKNSNTEIEIKTDKK